MFARLLGKFLAKWDSFNTICTFELAFDKSHVLVMIEDSKCGILLPKLFWPSVRKNCSSDWEKPLKFKAGGREFGNFLRSLG